MTRSLKISYGRARIPFEYDQNRFDVIGRSEDDKALSDSELGLLFDKPFQSPPLEEIISGGKGVLIVVPDATRAVGAGQILNLLVRRLIAAGTMPYDIEIIFATGLHRQVTQKERTGILTPFIEQRVKTFDHDPRDLSSFLNLGETSNGIPIELNRRLVESDHVILIGGIGFHYFAGFTGGRKLICPGLASKRTITATHSLAFDSDKTERRAGVGTALLEGNAVHESFVEVVENVAPSYSFNTFVDDTGMVTGMVSGDWKNSHLEACRIYSEKFTASISEKRDLVIVSCGGFPFDINMVQAHKAIENASRACNEGGTIIVVAECGDGPGSEEFAKHFDHANSSEIGKKLAEKYSVGGQTAWSLMQKAERFNLNIVTKLPVELTKKMGLNRFADFASALAASQPSSSGYILPFGAKYLPTPKQKKGGPKAAFLSHE